MRSFETDYTKHRQIPKMSDVNSDDEDINPCPDCNEMMMFHRRGEVENDEDDGMRGGEAG